MCDMQNVEFFQADFGSGAYTVYAVATQGRRDFDRWVTSYELSYSLYGDTFTPYEQNGIIKVGFSVDIFHIRCIIFN